MERAKRMKNSITISVLFVVVMFIIASSIYFYEAGYKNHVTPKGVTPITELDPTRPTIETSTPGIYFEPGSIVTATGFIKENIKQIDAPSYLLVLESEKSEDHLFKVFYAGDLCHFPLENIFAFGPGMKITIQGKAMDRQNISVCDDESFFVRVVPDL